LASSSTSSAPVTAAFLDPHEDALARIKEHLTEPGVRERVLEINLAGARGAARQPAWNLFELAASGSAEAERRVEAVVDAFSSALRWDERNARALNLTTQTAGALAAIARVLPAELCPTIFQLPTLLSDEDWRRACLPFLPKASQRFWLDRFPRLSEEAITPVTNLIDRLRASAATTALLGRSQSSYRIREAMDEGLIVLACPGSGGTRDRLVANLLVFDLLHAAKGRAELAPERRRPFFVFLDEVQTYDGASSGNLAALLEQTAKYGVRAFLLNQNPERLTAATLNAVTTNRSHLLTTTLNYKGAQLVAKGVGRPARPHGDHQAAALPLPLPGHARRRADQALRAHRPARRGADRSRRSQRCGSARADDRPHHRPRARGPRTRAARRARRAHPRRAAPPPPQRLHHQGPARAATG